MKLFSPSTKKFLSYAKPYRWLILGATVCGILKFNIPVAFPWVLKDIINQTLSPTPETAKNIHLYAVFLIALYLVWTVVTFLRSYLTGQAGQRIIFDLRHEFYAHLQRMSLSFYEGRQVGAIASRLFGDIAIAQNLLGTSFTNTIMDLSTLIIISILLFSMNWHLAVMALVILPVYVFLNKHFKTRLRESNKRAQEKMEEIAGQVNEELGGMSIIQSFSREKTKEKNFLRENNTYLDYRLVNIKTSAVATAVVGFLTSIAPVMVVWYGALQVIDQKLSVGELTAFYAYLGMFYQPLNRLTELNIQVSNSMAALDRIYEIFSTSPDIADRPDAQALSNVRGALRFERVSFSYDAGKPALEHISIDIPAGKVVALVGSSGSGKSTFARLLPRFYDVTSGSIQLDGVDIRDIKLKSLRRNIALVAQDPILFSGTISENMLFGKPNATEEHIQRAAQLANAHGFIEQLPNGYQTGIGEGGIRLSAGQRQRIALARAFLKKRPAAYSR